MDDNGNAVRSSKAMIFGERAKKIEKWRSRESGAEVEDRRDTLLINVSAMCVRCAC